MALSLTESRYGYHFNSSTSVCEIEEEKVSEINHGYLDPPMESIKEDVGDSLLSFDDYGRDHQDCVYVAVGKSESSMDALSWTLSHSVNPSTIIYLIHVFPETKYIPSPLGKMAMNKVNPKVLEDYMAQERGKRRQLLQKFLDACLASKVEVDTMLIESDMVTKAILDLIPILNIKKLILGTTKPNLRKSKSRRGSGIADQILQGAPATCDVKVICEGKEVIGQMIESPSPPPSPSPSASPHGNSRNSPKAKSVAEGNQFNDSFSCMCFKSKLI